MKGHCEGELERSVPKRFDCLKDISKIRIKEEDKEKVQPVPKKTREEEPEEHLFSRAMQDVRPVRGRGRQVPKRRTVPRVPPVSDQGAEMRTLKDIVDGTIEFEVEYTDEYVQAHVQGYNTRLFQKLKRGKLSIEGHLDLHGLNAVQAQTALLDFMQRAYMAEKRCVLVVTGRGLNSPAGMPVLKQEIQRWLTQEPFRRVVLAFCTSQPKDGGTGALYVLLRKSKKTRGKVIWNKWPMDLD
ncbi:MAG: Smr/MutS family protein [Desulfovibrionales bacterium]